jgi:uncharacterized phage-associated protein
LTAKAGSCRIILISGSIRAKLIQMSLTIAHRKATQALNYFARQEGGSINKLKALKLLFFADRYHLRKFGRPVSECTYFAMTHGPVASEAKHVAEDDKMLPATVRSYARKFLDKESNYEYASVADVDETVFSESDLAALNFAWESFGHHSGFQLRDITHHYPEWKRHERALSDHGHKRVKMDYADFFSEPDAGYNPCHALTTKEREVARALFLQRQAFVQRWS